MELRDLWLALRTRVWASEKAVSQRCGTSVTGWEQMVSTIGSSVEVAAAGNGPAVLSAVACFLRASSACCHGLLDAVLWMAPSLAVEFLLAGACLAARGGVTSAKLASPSWGVAARGRLWDLDGGRGALLGLGKRENPPAGGADMVSRELCSSVVLKAASFACRFVSLPSVLPEAYQRRRQPINHNKPVGDNQLSRHGDVDRARERRDLGRNSVRRPQASTNSN